MYIPSPEELRMLRKRAGLTQRELAERAGVSQSLIARIEAGKVDPRLSTYRKILNALKEALSEAVRLRDVMTSPVVYVSPRDPVTKAIEIMQRSNYSQLPVIDSNGKVVGTITEDDIVRALLTYGKEIYNKRVEEVMSDPLPTLPANERIDVAMKLLAEGVPAVLIVEKGEVVGIVTKSDLLSKYRKL